MGTEKFAYDSRNTASLRYFWKRWKAGERSVSEDQNPTGGPRRGQL